MRLHFAERRETGRAKDSYGQCKADEEHNPNHKDIHAEFRKFDMPRKLSKWDWTILDGHVPRGETRPKACLDQ